MKNEIVQPKRGFIHALFGLMFGDEGKGKAILDLCHKNKYTTVARWQGGPNAGHSLNLGNGKEFVAHLLPSGCVIHEVKLIMGNNMVIEPVLLKKEIEAVENFGFEAKDRLFISEKASLITPYHRVFDKVNEWLASNKIGTTGTGIGPAYGDRTLRKGIRMGEILNLEKFEKTFLEVLKNQQLHLKSYIALGFEMKASEEEKLNDELNEWIESIYWVRENLKIVNMRDKIEELLKSGEKILAEGAQGLLLDIDEGNYPYVTSSMTGPWGLFVGLSCGPNDVKKYYGVTKPYGTKVGEGDFPSRMIAWLEALFQLIGKEFGATTGRRRMCGYPDMVLLRHAISMFKNYGKLHIIMTKVDSYPVELLNQKIQAVTHYVYGNSQQTNKLIFPLSDVSDVITEDINNWYTPRGTTKLEGGDTDTLDLAVFINFIQNQLFDIRDDFEFEMIGTGPEVGQYLIYPN